MEILIAIFILAIVLSTIFVSYTSTLSLIDETESQAEAYGMARIALERIQEDLQSAFIFDEAETLVPERDSLLLTQFMGENKEIRGRNADSLRFLSRSHLVLDQWSREYGFAEIVYSVRESKDGDGYTLYRSDTTEVDRFLREDEEGLVLCEDLFSFNLTYYDSDGETYDRWDSTEEGLKNGLPAMVSISLDIVNKSNPKSPVKFLSGVALPVARIKYGRAS